MMTNFESLTCDMPDGTKRTFNVNSSTEYDEPQIYICFSDGTNLEITHEQAGLKPKDYYYTIRHNCSEEDFENNKYQATMGVIASFRLTNTEQLAYSLFVFMKNMHDKNITITED